jgi:hypothetical protein
MSWSEAPRTVSCCKLLRCERCWVISYLETPNSALDEFGLRKVTFWLHLGENRSSLLVAQSGAVWWVKVDPHSVEGQCSCSCWVNHDKGGTSGFAFPYSFNQQPTISPTNSRKHFAASLNTRKSWELISQSRAWDYESTLKYHFKQLATRI